MTSTIHAKKKKKKQKKQPFFAQKAIYFKNTHTHFIFSNCKCIHEKSTCFVLFQHAAFSTNEHKSACYWFKWANWLVCNHACTLLKTCLSVYLFLFSQTKCASLSLLHLLHFYVSLPLFPPFSFFLFLFLFFIGSYFATK